MNKNRVLWGLLAFVLLFSVIFSSARAGEEKALTLIIYMAGSDLETQNGSASADIQEMLSSGCDFSRVNIVLLAGGAESWRLGLSSGELSAIQLGSRGMRVLERFPLTSMGAPETLSSFLSWSVERFPAQEYALVFWNHGGGPMEGVCYDELFGRDHLSLSELSEALEASPFGPERPLSWIGFDACMMASLETAGVCVDYARYMIASQETEPAAGWDYSFLSRAAEQAGGAEAGRAIVDAYMAANAENDSVTLSCIDLRKLGPVLRCVSDLFLSLRHELNAETFSVLSNGRRDTRGFGRLTTLSEYDLADLYHLSEQYAEMAPQQAAFLQKALEDAVVCSAAPQPHAHGLSIYSPYYNKSSYSDAWRETSRLMSPSNGYYSWIGRFASYWLGDQLADWSGLAGRALPVDGAGVQALELPLTEEQQRHFASAKVVILRDQGYDESYFKVYEIADLRPQEGVLRAEYDFSGLYVVDGQGQIVSDIYPFDSLQEGRISLVAELEKESLFKSMVRQIREESPEPAESELVHLICTQVPGTDRLEVRDVILQPEDPTELTTGKQYLSIEASRFPFIFFSANRYAYLPVRDPESGRLLPYSLWQAVSIPLQDRTLLDREGNRLSVSEWTRNFHEQTVDAQDYLFFSEVDNSLPWSLEFRRDQVSPQALYAQFIVTDTQGVETATELIPLSFPALKDSRKLNRELYRDEEVSVELESLDVVKASSGSGLYLRFMVDNQTDMNLSFYCLNLSLNHTVIDNTVQLLPNTLEPHRRMRISMLIPPDQMPCLDSKLSRIGFTPVLWQTGHASDYTVSAGPQVLETDLDLSSLGLIPPGSLSPLAGDSTASGDFSVELLRLEEQKDGSLRGLLHFISGSEENIDFSFFLSEEDQYGDVILNHCFLRDVLHASHTTLTLYPGFDLYQPFTLNRIMQLEAVGSASAASRNLFPSLDGFSYWGIDAIRSLTVPLYVNQGYLFPFLALADPLPLSLDAAPSDTAEPVPLLRENSLLSLSLRSAQVTESGLLRLDLDLEGLSESPFSFRAVDCMLDGRWTDAELLSETYLSDQLFSPGWITVNRIEGAHRLIITLSPEEGAAVLRPGSALSLTFEYAPYPGFAADANGLDWRRSGEVRLTLRPEAEAVSGTLPAESWSVEPAGWLPEVNLADWLGGPPVPPSGEQEGRPSEPSENTLRFSLSPEQAAGLQSAQISLVLPCGQEGFPDLYYLLANFPRPRLEDSVLTADFGGVLAGLKGNDCPFFQHVYREEDVWHFLAAWLDLTDPAGETLLLAEQAHLTLSAEGTSAVTAQYTAAEPLPENPLPASFSDYLEVYRIPGLREGRCPHLREWEYQGMIDDTAALIPGEPAVAFRHVSDWPDMYAVFSLTYADGSREAFARKLIP